MSKTIFFDLDGTIADLYNVPDWLPKLRAFDPSPYIEARTMINMSLLARYLNKVQAGGWRIAVVSWLSKEPREDYDKAVTRAKVSWLQRHLSSVVWDEIYIVAHGTPKESFMTTPDDILFDDEEKNRINWLGTSYEPEKILEVLKNLCL